MGARYFVSKYDPKMSYCPDEHVLKESAARLRQEMLRRFAVREANCDGGLYVGLGGAAYAFWYLAQRAASEEDKRANLQQALTLIQFHLGVALKNANPADDASFLLGNAGLNAVGALVAKAVGDGGLGDQCLSRFAAAAAFLQSVDCLPDGGDELFVGRAGFLCAILNLRLKLGGKVVEDECVRKLMGAILESGRRYAKARRSPAPLMFAYHGTEYLGAAHGLSAILQLLLSFPEILRSIDGRAEEDVRRSVEFMTGLQQPNGNFPCATDEIRPPRQELVHWCHGAPGVIYLLSRAYIVWKEQKYLQACVKCGEVILEKGLLKKGPGICHGVAGSGYALLLLYRLTQDKKYLNQAKYFAAFLDTEEFREGARTPDCPFSLFEGTAGTICFLEDVLRPDQAEFPLFPVF